MGGQSINLKRYMYYYPYLQESAALAALNTLNLLQRTFSRITMYFSHSKDGHSKPRQKKLGKRIIPVTSNMKVKDFPWSPIGTVDNAKANRAPKERKREKQKSKFMTATPSADQESQLDSEGLSSSTSSKREIRNEKTKKKRKGKAFTNAASS